MRITSSLPDARRPHDPPAFGGAGHIDSGALRAVCPSSRSQSAHCSSSPPWQLVAPSRHPAAAPATPTPPAAGPVHQECGAATPWPRPGGGAGAQPRRRLCRGARNRREQRHGRRHRQGPGRVPAAERRPPSLDARRRRHRPGPRRRSRLRRPLAGVPGAAPPKVPGGPGAQVFANNGCGGCHTLAAAESGGVTGPDLDEVLPGQCAATVEKSIVDPNAEIAKGYPANVMPANFSAKRFSAQRS